MKHEIENFDIFPLVFAADKEAVITVKPLYQQSSFNLAKNIRVTYWPMLYADDANSASQSGIGHETAFKKVDDKIIIHQQLIGEQEHGFAIYTTKEDGSEEEWLRFNVYSLNEDLACLRPYKGDFHIHSMESDGRESPEYVIASCRKVGFDYAVLTDHHKYEPSLQAKQFAESLPTALKVFPGEEVHLPDNPVHIVNFGSSFSVNELAAMDKEAYYDDVNKIIETLPPEVPEQVRFQVASSEWAYKKIHEGDGLAMFCHPYWRTTSNYIWESCIDWMFKRAKFDILELLGGFYRHQAFSNNESVARYNQEMIAAAGNVNWSVAGVSDAHGCDRDLFGWYYTVTFSESCEFESLKSAFTAKRSVAVKSIENECPEMYGDLRYVRYMGFLMKNFYPKHDSLCSLEGGLMLRHLAGESGIPELLTTFPERHEALFDKYWDISRK